MCSVAQLFPTFCEPMDCSPPGSSVHGIIQGKNTGVGCHFLPQRIFPTQGSNSNLLGFPNQQADSLPPNHLGSLSWRVDSMKNQASKIIFSNFTFSRYKLFSSFNSYSTLGLRLPCSLQIISTQETNTIPDFKHETQRADSWPSAI